VNAALVSPIVPPLATVTAAALVGEHLGEIAWHLPGLIPVGAFVVLYGSPKAGKSTLGMHMAACLAGAQPFLEGTGVLNVLWLDLEQPRRVTQARVREVHAHGAVGNFDVYQGAPPSLAEVFATIDRLKPDVVFVDSLSRWLCLESENDNAELTRTLGPILTGFQARDVTLLVIHHDRKSEGTGGRNLRGASGLLAMCDVAVEIKVEGEVNSTRRRLAIVSRHEGQRQMVVRLTDQGFVDDGPSMPQHAAEVLAACGNGPRTGEDIAVLVNTGLRTLKPVIEALVRQGKLMLSGGGKKGSPFLYVIPCIPGDSWKSENTENPKDSMHSSPTLGVGRIHRNGAASENAPW
jgi:archaellum biogenesis ATPase FlaH